jgi:predicted lipoprotein with Yx(FWY)xxD motif
MTMKHAQMARAGLLAAGLLTVAACGAGGGYGGSNAATNTSSGTSAKPGLKVASTSLGKVVVDSRGHTVYELTADQQGKSSCSTACLTEWPAVPSLKGKAAPASITAAVGSAAATSGMQMATVGGRPVYTFSQDQASGDVKGEGLKDFGGTWWAVSPSGAPVKGASAPSGY